MTCIPKWVDDGLRVGTAPIPWIGSAVEKVLDCLQERADRRQTVHALLDTATQTWTPDSSPAALLRADFGVVPFHGRADEKADLSAWCDGEGQVALRLYTAPGGFGKTRLLRELARWRREIGWDAGFLPEGAILEYGPAALFDGPGKPLLLVLDYAESRGEEIQAVVAAARESSREKVRIVLLARSEGDWWGELQAAGDGVGDFFQGPRVEDPIRLRPLTDSPESRQASYEEAIQAFAETLDQPVSAGTPSLEDEDFERVLLIHATALAAVEGEDVPPGDLLEWLLKREERGLLRVREDVGLGQEFDRPLRQAAALLTLAQGADSRSKTVDVIRRASSLKDQPRATMEEIAEALHVLYHGRRWCDGVEPDLVGEHLVQRELREAPELLDGAFGEEVSETRLENGLTVLNRLAQREPEPGRELLAGALRRRLDWLGVPAMKVAVEGGDPIGPILADELAENGDAELARKLQPYLPHPTTALRRAAAEIEGLLRQELLARGKENLNKEELVELARWSSDLSVSLADLGRREEALSAIEESVAVCRELASSRPDAFRSALAMSLNNLSLRLADLGRREGALSAIEESVKIRRELASSRPDVFRSALAMSLNNLSAHLSDLGRREEALSAIEESVEIRRELASSRPDAFRPDLAMSLNNLSNHLSDLSRREAALSAIEESVAVYRELVSSRPDAFRPDLAQSLNNLSLRLADLGREEAALTMIEESVTMYRELVSSRPDAFRPALANSLNTLSTVFLAIGCQEAALEAAVESLETLEPYFRRLPVAYTSWMETMVSDYKNIAQACGVEPDEERLREIRAILATVEGEDHEAPEAH